jgi:hypothetical protein
LANASGTYSAWSYMRTVTIDHTKVQSNLANFPVLITLTDANLAAHAKSTGDDILFTLQDGTKLFHEIESYTSSSGTIVTWVKIPSISSTVDTTINMYYGNPSASNQQDAIHVWDSNNYKAVWHLPAAGATLSAKDSTNNHKDGTTVAAASTTGKIDGAGNFAAGSSNYVGVTDTTYFNLANIAVSAWIKPSGTQGANTDVIDKCHDGKNGWVLEYTSNGQNLIFFMSNGATMIAAQSTTALNDNTWHFVVGTCDGSSVKLYVDGVQQASTSYSGNAVYVNKNLAIGRWETTTPSRYFNGAIDEVRISSAATSADWIKTEYNNQNSPASFAIVSSEIVNPGVSVLPESPVGSLAVVLTIAVGCGVFVKYKNSSKFKV